jgi:hypothetical protein
MNEPSPYQLEQAYIEHAATRGVYLAPAQPQVYAGYRVVNIGPNRAQWRAAKSPRQRRGISTPVTR